MLQKTIARSREVDTLVHLVQSAERQGRFYLRHASHCAEAHRRAILASCPGVPKLRYRHRQLDRPFRLCCGDSEEGFGVTHEHEQYSLSVRPILFSRLATIESGRHWTPLDLEAASVAWTIMHVRGYF